MAAIRRIFTRGSVPAIGPNKYQVGAEVVAAVQEHFGTTDGLIRRDPADGTAYLDLWAANRLDLERAGVLSISTWRACAPPNTSTNFSRIGRRKGKTGRFGAVIALYEHCGEHSARSRNDRGGLCAGRARSGGVTLIAVSKTHPASWCSKRRRRACNILARIA